MPDPIRIALVDDHPIILSGLRHALRASGFAIVAEGLSAADALLIAEQASPDVMLLDIFMPGDGLEAVRGIRTRFPQVKTIVFTASTLTDHVVNSVAAGASGYLLKGADIQEVRTAIRTVASGERHVTPAATGSLLSHLANSSKPVVAPPAGVELSTRELEIIAEVELGHPNKEIAKRLNLAIPTIKNIISRLMRKFGARNRIDVVRRARRNFVSSE